MHKKCLFLDRDGVINFDAGYVHTPEQFKFKKDIFDLIKYANANSYLVVVVTNQSGIGRGYYSENEFNHLTNWMLDKFKSNGCFIERVYFCPYHPTQGIGCYKRDSKCRKPLPGMINSAVSSYNIDPTKSLMVGDKMTDIEAGFAAGITELFLFNPDEHSMQLSIKSTIPHLIVNSLMDLTFYMSSEVK